MTGVGLVSPVGMGTQANWDALCAGTSGIGPITRFDAAAFSTRFAGEVKNFDPLQFIEKKELKKMDIFIQFAVAASQFAMDDAKLTIDAGAGAAHRRVHRLGHRRVHHHREQHSAYLEGGPRKISPFFIPSAIINLAAGQVSIRFGAKGPNLATCTACTASAHAIGDSFEIIKRGAADAMITGGAEAAVCHMGVGGFAALRALSQRNDDPARASRPFDKDRDGFVLGEGAGILILEELEMAKRRGAHDLRRNRRLRHVRRRVPHDRAGRRRRRRRARDAGGARSRRRRARASSTTSTPTAPRRRINDRIETTAIKRRSSATTPTSWRCRRPSR